MDKLLKITLAVLVLLIGQNANAQSAFTLKEAQDYAVKNNPNVVNSQIDYELAVAQKNQVRAIGLPQITASGDARWNQRTVFQSLINKQLDDAYASFKDKNPTSNIQQKEFETLFNTSSGYFSSPNKAFIDLNDTIKQRIVSDAVQGGGFAGLIGTTFNANFQNTITLSVSQILFSSDYIVALQTSSVYLGLAKMSTKLAETQIKTSVAKAYYNVLVGRERIKLLEINIEKLKLLLDDSKAYLKEGFVENIDVSRLEVNYNNLVTESKKVKNLLALGEASLKFAMSYDIMQPITLSDSIQNVDSPELAQFSKSNYKNRIEYNLLETQQKMNELNLKRYKYSVLPTLAFYGQNGWNQYLQSKDNLQPGQKNDTYFYRQTVMGLSLNVPIFSGGSRYYNTQMAKLNISKTKNSIKNFEAAIDLETNAAVVNYNNAIESIGTQKKNMLLADDVFKVTTLKYENGVGSNLELVNATQSVRESQANYIEALYNYYNAKIDLDKALGNIK